MKVLRIFIFILIAAAVSFGAAARETIGSKLDTSVRSVQVILNGPVVIHAGTDRCEVKVIVKNSADSYKVKVYQADDKVYVGPKDNNSEPPEVEKVEIWGPFLTQLSFFGNSDVDIAYADVNALMVQHYGVGTIKSSRIDATQFVLGLFGVVNSDIGKLDATSARIALAGRCDVNFRNMDVANLDVTLSGNGNIDLGRIDATGLNINVCGTGHVKVKGYCTTARLFSNTSGSIDATGLEATRIINTDYDKISGQSTMRNEVKSGARNGARSDQDKKTGGILINP